MQIILLYSISAEIPASYHESTASGKMRHKVSPWYEYIVHTKVCQKAQKQCLLASEKMKPITLVVVKLHLSDRISRQSGNQVNRTSFKYELCSDVGFVVIFSARKARSFMISILHCMIHKTSHIKHLHVTFTGFLHWLFPHWLFPYRGACRIFIMGFP